MFPKIFLNMFQVSMYETNQKKIYYENAKITYLKLIPIGLWQVGMLELMSTWLWITPS